MKGEILVDNDAALASITGLDAVTSVLPGNVKIFTDNALTTISGFSKLANISGTLEVHDNLALANLDATSGFEGLTGIGGSILIYNNPALTSIGGFTALTTGNAAISIHDTGVQTITGFGNLTDLIGDLNIANNQALTSVAGFTKLGQIGGSLIVRDSDVLTNLNGLANVVDISLNLTVVSNPVLNTLLGLRSGTLKANGVGNLYTVQGNPALSSCEVAALKTTLGVKVFNDQSGANSGCTTCTGVTCSAGAGGITGQSGTFTGDAVVVNLADLAWMKNIVNLTGSLHVDGSALSSLAGITNLKSIGADLSIQNNLSLASLTGLSGLQNVTGDMYVNSNTALTNVNALSALTGVAGYLQFYNNVGLTNLGGLTALSTVGKDFNILSDNALTNVDGLINLTSVGGNLQLASNPNLTSIINLIKPTGKLANLGGTLTVGSNAKLPSCQPDALKAALVAAQAWNKAYSQSSNLACVSPKTCSGAMNAICQ